MAYGLQHLLNHNKPKILKEFAPPVVRGNQVLLFKHALLNVSSSKIWVENYNRIILLFQDAEILIVREKSK